SVHEPEALSAQRSSIRRRRALEVTRNDSTNTLYLFFGYLQLGPVLHSVFTGAMSVGASKTSVGASSRSRTPLGRPIHSFTASTTQERGGTFPMRARRPSSKVLISVRQCQMYRSSSSISLGSARYFTVDIRSNLQRPAFLSTSSSKSCERR